MTSAHHFVSYRDFNCKQSHLHPLAVDTSFNSLFQYPISPAIATNMGLSSLPDQVLLQSNTGVVTEIGAIGHDFSSYMADMGSRRLKCAGHLS
jgi:hypothetical protein